MEQENNLYNTLEYFISITNNLSGLDIRENTRKKNHVFARTMYYGLARKYTLHSLEHIGQTLNKNHATVLHSLKRLEMDIINNDDNFWSDRWKQANLIIKNVRDDNKYFTEKEVKIRMQVLADQNKALLEEINRLSRVDAPEDEKKLLELFRMLPEDDKKLLILKAEVTIKMKQDELRRRQEENERIESRRKSRFSSYLADAEI